MTKFNLQLTSIAILFITCLPFCRKHNSLPSQTTSGAGSFGCTVNGRIFTPKDNINVPGISSYNQLIYPGESGYVFQVQGTFRTPGFESIYLIVDSAMIGTGQTFTLRKIAPGGACGGYFVVKDGKNFSAETSGLNNGELHFTRFDRVAQIASGTFWFDVKLQDSSLIQIRNGVFDVKFTY